MVVKTGKQSLDPLARGSRDWVADLGWLAVVALAMLVVTAVPYVYAYRSPSADKQFMGILLNVPDTAQYLSWARESMHSLLIRNKLTPEPGPAVYLNLFWFGVGRLALVLRMRLDLATQLARQFTVVGFLATAYWFISLLTKQRRERWLSFLVVLLGSGLGWILIVLKVVTGIAPIPADVYTYESNTFLTLLAFPHQAMADALLLLVLGLAALAFERSSLRLAALAGVITLVLGSQHGYDLVIVYTVLGVTSLVLAGADGHWVRRLSVPVVVGAISAPAALYLFLLSKLSPMWAGVLSQYGNAGVFTPPPFHLLIVMGLPLIALLAVPRRPLPSRDASAREVLLATWLVVGALLLYLPVGFQIKMFGGWQIPVGIFATRAVLTRFEPSLPKFPTWRIHSGSFLRREIVVAAVFLAAVVPTNLYLYAWRFYDLGHRTYPYYLTQSELAGLHWLEKNSNPSDVVLSSLTTGEYVPSVSGNNAFLAHWAATLDYFGKRQLVDEFFKGGVSDTARRAIVNQYDVRYVFYGPTERELGSYNPVTSHWLTKVFSDGSVSVYRVGKEKHSTGAGSQP